MTTESKPAKKVLQPHVRELVTEMLLNTRSTVWNRTETTLIYCLLAEFYDLPSAEDLTMRMYAVRQFAQGAQE